MGDGYIVFMTHQIGLEDVVFDYSFIFKIIKMKELLKQKAAGEEFLLFLFMAYLIQIAQIYFIGLQLLK